MRYRIDTQNTRMVLFSTRLDNSHSKPGSCIASGYVAFISALTLQCKNDKLYPVTTRPVDRTTQYAYIAAAQIVFCESGKRASQCEERGQDIKEGQ